MIASENSAGRTKSDLKEGQYLAYSKAPKSTKNQDRLQMKLGMINLKFNNLQESLQTYKNEIE